MTPAVALTAAMATTIQVWRALTWRKPMARARRLARRLVRWATPFRRKAGASGDADRAIIGGVLLGLCLCALLAIVTVTDLDRRVIPNRVLVVAAASAIAIAALGERSSLAERLVAALVGGGLLLPLALAYPDGLGMGDVKLVAVIGLFLGPATAAAVLVAFAAGGLTGAVLIARDGAAARKRSLPFAPFLAAGSLVALWAGDPVVHWYVTS